MQHNWHHLLHKLILQCKIKRNKLLTKYCVALQYVNHIICLNTCTLSMKIEQFETTKFFSWKILDKPDERRTVVRHTAMRTSYRLMIQAQQNTRNTHIHRWWWTELAPETINYRSVQYLLTLHYIRTHSTSSRWAHGHRLNQLLSSVSGHKLSSNITTNFHMKWWPTFIALQ